MTRLLCFLLIFPAFIHAQKDDRGIKFEDGSSWQQVVDKARKENKYIFMDCYATWCMPCKKMDKNVFSRDEVGEFFNDRFISVKAQMDKTEKDGVAIKRWYVKAEQIAKEFSVTTYPTYLFFDPGGFAVHKIVGSMEAEKFIAETEKALDPKTQFYTLRNKYRAANLDTGQLRKLVYDYSFLDKELSSDLAVQYLKKIPIAFLGSKEALGVMILFPNSIEIQNFVSLYLKQVPEELFDTPDNRELISSFSRCQAVQQIIFKYLAGLNSKGLKMKKQLLFCFQKIDEVKPLANRYIRSLTKDEIYSADNLIFLGNSTKSIDEIGFKIFNNPSSAHKAEKIIRSKKGYENAKAKDFANYIFVSGYLQKHFESAIKGALVNWDEIELKFKRKLEDKFVKENIQRTKVRALYSLTRNNGIYWDEYIDENIKFIQKYGTDTTNSYADVIEINNFVFEAIFNHSNNPEHYKIGLNWMEGVLRRNPYDPNNIDTYANLLYKSGRTVEALQWQNKAISLARETKDLYIDNFVENLEKMKRGEPTWKVSSL